MIDSVCTGQLMQTLFKGMASMKTFIFLKHYIKLRMKYYLSNELCISHGCKTSLHLGLGSDSEPNLM